MTCVITVKTAAADHKPSHLYNSPISVGRTRKMSVYVLRFLTQHIYGTDCLAQENVCSSFYNTKKNN